jgi:hypothetical protein
MFLSPVEKIKGNKDVGKTDTGQIPGANFQFLLALTANEC